MSTQKTVILTSFYYVSVSLCLIPTSVHPKAPLPRPPSLEERPLGPEINRF